MRGETSANDGRASPIDRPVPLVRRLVSGVEVVEFRVDGPCDLATHAHDHAFLSVLLLGGYTIGEPEPVDVAAPMAAYFPPRVERSISFAPGASQFLWIRVPEEIEAELSGARCAPRGFLPFPADRSQWLASRLAVEMRRRDTASPLLAHGLVLELLGGLVRSVTDAERAQPGWLAVALQEMHREETAPRIGEIAARCGLHTTHFTRAFKRHLGCTPGEYVRQLRVTRARLMLLSTDVTLAEIAIRCGFADQAHFGREFRRVVGSSPSAFRRDTSRR